MARRILGAALFVALLTPALCAQSGSLRIIDLADQVPGVDTLTRVLGPDNDNGGVFTLGNLGVSVGSGGDLDGDGFEDCAIAHMLMSPFGRTRAGQVAVIFGNGTTGELLDLATPDVRFLRIFGSGEEGAQEMAGNEIWIDDVTGDGIADLLVGRQNYSLPSRPGVGALTVIVGGPALRDLATAQTPIDLAAPPATVTMWTLIGPQPFARLGLWMRSDDVDGDGVADIVVAADQETQTSLREGAVYVVRGGAHLAAGGTADLISFGSTSIAGNIARIVPPDGAFEFHFGGTCQMGDLDGNGRSEVMAAATLNRAGASVGPFGSADGSGGATFGRLFIVWDDAFPPTVPWPNGFEIDLQTPPAGTLTTITGGSVENDSFGEEILGGLDYSGDGLADLFVGDLVGDAFGGSLGNSGIGYVFYDAASLKGLTFDMENIPVGVTVTTIAGPSAGAIGADTAAHGDFNGDGIGDLMIGNPKADPQGRDRAGTLNVLLGQTSPWPAFIDTAPGTVTPGVDLVEIQGVLGDVSGDLGDTMGYSASIGDLDNDGLTDLIVNEMRGNGSGPDAIDSGNLLIIPGAMILEAVTTLPLFVRGDANVDGSFNIADPITALGHLFQGNAVSCELALDANADDNLDIGDPIFLLSAIFSGGPLPAAPHPDCGTDPSATLTCASFDVCN
ncbi:MAG: hypothetical protein AAF488_06945 [Planctomycetota bacterium]